MDKGRPKRLDVWLVEDDAAYRQMLAFVVDNASGLRVDREFGDCETAIEMASDGHRADIVLLDIGLPGIDGIQGIRKLKELMPRARVVMLSMFDDADRIFGAFREGASGYLSKGASVEQVIAAIREAAAGGMLMPSGVAEKVRDSFFKPTQTDYGLTNREQEVLAAMCDGLTQKEIGERLFIASHTVNTHIRHIYEKMHVNSGLAAVAKAFKERLVD